MPSPFPGMDPYLERPGFWPGVHHWLIIEIGRFLSPQLRPKYRVAVEVRTYQTTGGSMLVGLPDVAVQRVQASSRSDQYDRQNVAVLSAPAESVTVTLPMPEMVKEGYLEIREVGTEAVVTAIEILSPSNKRSGEGRDTYEKKRQRVLGSATHLVEIDLLRAGKPMPTLNNNIESNYRILVSRADRRPYADLYAFDMPSPIPSFSLPLQPGDAEPVLDLQFLLNEVYDLSGYDLAIAYSQEPVPPLSEADAAWADAWLRARGLR